MQIKEVQAEQYHFCKQIKEVQAEQCRIICGLP
jgi:hypothetical protein